MPARLIEQSPLSRRIGGPVRTLHGSAASMSGAGVLLLGPPGVGKSDLLLRLLDRGFSLVADDQVCVEAGHASAPAHLAGLLEVRGLGVVRLAHVSARLVLAVRLEPGERLPPAARLPDLDLPIVYVDPRSASAPLRVAMALQCATGKLSQLVGFLHDAHPAMICV